MYFIHRCSVSWAYGPRNSQRCINILTALQDYRNRIISELEERMQQHDLTQTAAATAATQNRETFV